MVNTDSYDDILTGDETDISYTLLTNRILDNAINNTITIFNQSEADVLNNFNRYSIPRPRNPPDLRNNGNNGNNGNNDNTSSLPNINAPTVCPLQ